MVYEDLATRDWISGIQGRAGTGKTTALTAVRELAGEHGYQTHGLGPTSRAAKGLSEAGIGSETLQSWAGRGEYSRLRTGGNASQRSRRRTRSEGSRSRSRKRQYAGRRPGELRIEFFGAEDLLRHLYELSQAMVNDFRAAVEDSRRLRQAGRRRMKKMLSLQPTLQEHLPQE